MGTPAEIEPREGATCGERRGWDAGASRPISRAEIRPSCRRDVREIARLGGVGRAELLQRLEAAIGRERGNVQTDVERVGQFDRLEHLIRRFHRRFFDDELMMIRDSGTK